jgi:hypothetical protein
VQGIGPNLDITIRLGIVDSSWAFDQRSTIVADVLADRKSAARS